MNNEDTIATPTNTDMPHALPARGFRIRWYNWVLWLVTAVLMAISAHVAPHTFGPGVSEAYRAGHEAGAVLGGILLPTIVALVASLIAFFVSRRSTSTLNVTLLVVLILLLLFGCLSVAGNLMRRDAAERARAQNATSLKQLDDLRSSLKQRTQEKLDENGTSAPTLEEAADASHKMDDIASRFKGEDAVIVKAAAAAAKRMMDSGVTMGKAVSDFSEAGGVSPSTLKTREDIEQRLALTAQLKKANDALRATIETSSMDYRQSLINGGVKPERADSNQKSFERGANFPALFKMCDARDDFTEAAHDCLSVLKDQWGKWTSDGDDVKFSDDSATAAFSKASERLNKAEEAQVEVMKAIGLQRKAPAPAGPGK